MLGFNCKAKNLFCLIGYICFRINISPFGFKAFLFYCTVFYFSQRIALMNGNITVSKMILYLDDKNLREFNFKIIIILQ